MIDFVVTNWLSIIMGGAVVALWSIARDRRKAVDRLTAAIEEASSVVAWPEAFPDEQNARCGCRRWLKGWIAQQGLDATGRIIARSVERMTKEKR